MNALVPDRLASGRLIDLAAPPAEFDFYVEIAQPMAKVARFAGQTPGAAYSVAEHSVRGADAILATALTEPVDAARFARAAALAFLLHDAHEVLGGDVKRPFMDLCELLAARSGMAPGGLVRSVVEAAKAHLDVAIHGAAGLAWPLPPEIALVVRDMDERMAAEEMRRFWPGVPLPPGYEARPRVAIPDWQGRSVEDRPPWPAARAGAEWMERYGRWRRAA